MVAATAEREAFVRQRRQVEHQNVVQFPGRVGIAVARNWRQAIRANKLGKQLNAVSDVESAVRVSSVLPGDMAAPVRFRPAPLGGLHEASGRDPEGCVCQLLCFSCI